jgi:general secretion pathway protein G
VTRAEETVLRENLALMRDALDQHYADAGRYPERIEDLVERRYLRALPVDPLTQRSDTWVAVPPEDPDPGRASRRAGCSCAGWSIGTRGRCRSA